MLVEKNTFINLTSKSGNSFPNLHFYGTPCRLARPYVQYMFTIWSYIVHYIFIICSLYDKV